VGAGEGLGVGVAVGVGEGKGADDGVELGGGNCEIIGDTEGVGVGCG
jgi:hypothetical protein